MLEFPTLEKRQLHELPYTEIIKSGIIRLVTRVLILPFLCTAVNPIFSILVSFSLLFLLCQFLGPSFCLGDTNKQNENSFSYNEAEKELTYKKNVKSGTIRQSFYSRYIVQQLQNVGLTTRMLNKLILATSCWSVASHCMYPWYVSIRSVSPKRRN